MADGKKRRGGKAEGECRQRQPAQVVAFENSPSPKEHPAHTIRACAHRHHTRAGVGIPAVSVPSSSSPVVCCPFWIVDQWWSLLCGFWAAVVALCSDRPHQPAARTSAPHTTPYRTRPPHANSRTRAPQRGHHCERAPPASRGPLLVTMMTQTAVAHVLPRLRSLLPVARSLLVVPLASHNKGAACDTDAFGCGICFPHHCSCSATEVAASASASASLPAAADSSATSHSGAVRRPRATSVRTANDATNGAASTMEPKALSVAAAKQRAFTAAQQQQQQQQGQRRADAAAVPGASGAVGVVLGVVAPCVGCGRASPSPSHTSAASNALNPCRQCRIITPAELAAHNSLEAGLWICISAGVYDLTAWAVHHPGGLLPLQDTAGSDCTDVFRVFHSDEIMRTRLPPFKIGVMGDFDAQGKLVEDESAWGETPMQKVRSEKKDTHTHARWGNAWRGAGDRSSRLEQRRGTGLIFFFVCER